jgi:hypothetical protein
VTVRRRTRLTLGTLLGAFLVLAPGASAQAATYYVDQSAGSDGNVGTSPATPWKNAPGMSAFAGSGTLRAGDTVYFDSADTWLVTGTQGLYLVGGVTYIGDSWGVGTRATIRANADLAAGVVRFRDHPTVSTVFKGFDVDANRKVASGIDINHAFYSVMTGATKRVENSVVHHIASRQSLGQYKYGIIISNHGGSGGWVDNVEIIDTVVHDVSRDAICLYPGDESADSRIRNITVRGAEVYNTGQDPDYCCGAGILVKGYVVDAVIEFSHVHDVKGASLFVNGNETRHYPGVGPTNIHVRHNLFTNATVHGAIRLFDGASGGDPKDVKIYGNIVYNSTVNGGFLIDSDLKNSLSVRLYNNTFFNAPVIIRRSGATVNVLEFRNNIVHYTGGVPLTDADGVITAHSNNIYSRPGGGTLVSSRGTSYTAASLGTYEASASGADPMFMDPADLPRGFTGGYSIDRAPDGGGLRLRPGSVGLDRGMPLGTAYGTSINTTARPAGAGWDIGAYELGAGGVRPGSPTNLRLN